jgi:hypothetical protein
MAAVCYLVMSCDASERAETKAAQPAPATPPAVSASAAPAPGTPQGTGSAVPTGAGAAAARAVDGNEVQALVDSWLSAQNKRDFPTYETLYATRFEGLKRVGARSFRFDRRAWLKDRKGMFRHAIRVRTMNLSVTAGTQSAVVRFDQSFAAPGFRDIGRKQLVVVREAESLKIAREEMLSSTLTAASAPVQPVAAGDFSFVKTFGKRAFAVLDTVARPTEGSQPEFVDYRAATRAVREDQLDDATRTLSAKRLALYGAKGKLCEARVGTVSVLAHVIPHFGQVQSWKEAGDARPTRESAAAELWRLSEAAGGRSLVGELWAEGCEGAIWARAADLPPAAVYRETKLEDAAVERALTAFRRLSGYRTLQSQYTRDFGKRGAWDADERTSRQVSAFSEPDADERYVVASAFAPGCGDFYGEFWALFREAQGQLTLLSDPKGGGGHFVPVAAFDANGDGQPEFVSEDSRLELVRGRYQRSATVAPPDLDCGC